MNNEAWRGDCYDSPLLRRQYEMERDREAGEWQDHWDAIRKGECEDERLGGMCAPGYEDWED